MEAKYIQESGDVAYTPILDTADILSFQYNYLIKGKDSVIQKRAFCRKIGRLVQDYKNTQEINTIFPTCRAQIPKNKQVTYNQIVCDIRP